MTDLIETLRLHDLWLRGEPGGVRASLSGADLREASLRGANLSGADLRRANLRRADLRRADLRWADLSGADLREADLREASLSVADLSGADLRRADLSGADLRWADLRRADLGAGRVAACYWTDHGERGRELLGVALPDDSGTLRLRLYCGCFAGSAQDLRDYIAAGEERYRQSRTAALEFVLARMAEMGVSRD